MKKFYTYIMCLILGTTSAVYAQDTMPYPAILQMENAVVVQDSAVTQLVKDKIAGVTRGISEIQGWRVQIYSSNEPAVAKLQADSLYESWKEIITDPIYMIYTSPFWKVRIGNFRTQEEAVAYKEQLLTLYPELTDTYVVRDKIVVKQ